MNKPQNLGQSINIQEGSVVSKEIVNTPAGTVTLFAFDQGQGLSEHTAPFDALVLVVEGSAEITVAGEMNIVKSGDYLLMPANHPHSIKTIEPFKMLLTMFKL